jgi:hypothetical protein
MAVNFPASPTNNQVFTSGGISWIYSTAIGAWKILPNTIQGTTGLQGIQGIQGAGVQGLSGTSQGIQGLQGLQGTSVQGASGTSQGIQGIQGLQGRQGIQGASIQGTTGTQGASIASSINATAVTTDAKLYPVLVYSAGSTQTAQTITSFTFNSTFSTFTIGANAATAALITYNGATASQKGMLMQAATVNRWYVGTDAFGEGGSNTGTNFAIVNYSDTGTSIGTTRPMTIYRANGTVAIANLTSISTLTSTGPATFNSTGQFYGRLYGYSNQTVAAGTMLNATGSLGGIEVQGPNSANSAFMCFHKPGNYASYFGIDTDNQFAVGGWSAGAALANMKVGSLGVGTAATGTAGQIQATNIAIAADTNNRFIQGKLILRNDNPTIYFRDTDHNSAMIHNNSNLLYVLRGNTDSETFYTVPGTGQWPFYWNLTNNDATCGGSFSSVFNITAYVSDERLKKDIETIKNPLEKVKQIRGITYKNNEVANKHGFMDDAEQVGVLSQEIQKVLPQVIAPAPFDKEANEDGTYSSKSGENYKTVQYDRIVPLLIEAIKELSEQVDDMKRQIKELKEKI